MIPRTESPAVVGRIQGPYGIKGWVHVAAYTQPKENILRYKPWLLGTSAAANDWREVEVEQIRAHKQGFVAALSGVADRNGAEALKGSLIAVSAELFPEPPAGEYYWRDLIGARVIDLEDVLIGQVRELIETGAHDVLVIARPSGAEVLIPFHENYLVEVRTDEQLIRVDWSDPEDD